MADLQVTDIWHDYQMGRDYLDSVNLFTKVETCHNFMNGDQWAGLKYGTERPPSLNILQIHRNLLSRFLYLIPLHHYLKQN